MSNFDFMRKDDFKNFSNKYFDAELAYVLISPYQAFLSFRPALESGIKWLANRKGLIITDLSAMLYKEYNLGLPDDIRLKLKDRIVSPGNSATHDDKNFGQADALESLKLLHKFAKHIYKQTGATKSVGDLRLDLLPQKDIGVPELIEFLQRITAEIFGYYQRQEDVLTEVRILRDEIAEMKKTALEAPQTVIVEATASSTKKKTLSAGATEDARVLIKSILERAKADGLEYYDILSKDIHRQLNWPNNYPQVCGAMRSVGYPYEVLQSPPKNNGATLKYRYRLK